MLTVFFAAWGYADSRSFVERFMLSRYQNISQGYIVLAAKTVAEKELLCHYERVKLYVEFK